jgi:ribosomal-protein-alanine N-acetyltransferase
MRLFRRFSGDPVTERLDSSAAQNCAALHATSFAHPWDASEFENLLASSTVEATGIRRGRIPLGFILSRAAGPEAEVLTLVVARRGRRQGLGRKLLDANLLALAKTGVRQVFLEVDDANVAAGALYRRFDFAIVGRRENYYRTAGGTAAHALVMRHDVV